MHKSIKAKTNTVQCEKMVYTLEPADEYPDMLVLKTDKPRETWDPDVFPCVDVKKIEECERGFQMVKQGMNQMFDSDVFTTFTFNVNECGAAMGENEPYLLCLVLLKHYRCISLDSKVVFSWAKQTCVSTHSWHEASDDSIINFEIANEKTNMLYDLEMYEYTVFIDKHVSNGISVQKMEDDAKKRFHGPHSCKNVNRHYMVMRMDVVDFGSMFARLEVFGRERKGQDTLGRVLAVLMGTHWRLGVGSESKKCLLFDLDFHVVGNIAKSALSPVMREAVEAGVVRF